MLSKLLYHATVLNGLRQVEDSWIFEDPVTESIAPGYFEVIDIPMDYTTVEKRIETGHYQVKDEVGVCRGCLLFCLFIYGMYSNLLMKSNSVASPLYTCTTALQSAHCG